MKQDEGGPYRAIGQGYELVAVGITFAFTITGAALLGFWLDKRLGTVPLFTLIGTLGGMALGGFWLWSRLARETEGSDNE